MIALLQNRLLPGEIMVDAVETAALHRVIRVFPESDPVPEGEPRDSGETGDGDVLEENRLTVLGLDLGG